jgi:ABC-type bacteriocin/lantibiotic exporter with double-glycine peptidase domain
MNVVLQEETSGCGIACVAMLADPFYQEVKKQANSMAIFAEDSKLYSDTDYVKRLLGVYDLPISNEEKPFTHWEKLPEKALLSIKYRLENNSLRWHWVVFVRENNNPFVLDTAKYLDQNKRVDFENMSPKWLIEIYEK